MLTEVHYVHGVFIMCCMITVFFDPADNPLLSNKVTVTVNVLDVNEFPPELAVPFDTFVCENAEVGQASTVPL